MGRLQGHIRPRAGKGAGNCLVKQSIPRYVPEPDGADPLFEVSHLCQDLMSPSGSSLTKSSTSLLYLLPSHFHRILLAPSFITVQEVVKLHHVLSPLNYLRLRIDPVSCINMPSKKFAKRELTPVQDKENVDPVTMSKKMQQSVCSMLSAARHSHSICSLGGWVGCGVLEV